MEAAPATPRTGLPAWSWAYVNFRLGDGLSNLLIPLAVVVRYHEPIWMLGVATAVQNLAGVPATFVWGAIVDRTPQRRRVVAAGFLVAAVALAVMAANVPFWLFVVAAAAYTGFGVATAPAASTLVLQGRPRTEWATATGALSRRTGLAYLTGLLIATGVGLAAGAVDFAGDFAAAAVLSLGAGMLALRTVPTWRPPLPHEADYDPRLAQASQRLFERNVFFPGRLRNRPRLGDVAAAWTRGHRLWPFGIALTFVGSVCFFTSYPGVLSGLGLSAGLVLLCQTPSNLVSPLAYPLAGRTGARIGEARAVLRGSAIRTTVVPVLALLLGTIAHPGWATLAAVIVLHGLMGLSFALLQVNGVVMLAREHPGGRGRGVGTYHAAVGTGTLVGSALAYVLLRTQDYRVSYIVSVLVAGLGAGLLVAAARRSARRSASAG